MQSSSETTHPLKGYSKPLKQLNRIAKRPPLDIEFQDLEYAVRDRNIKGGWRQLLKSINGKFRSGELTAIMGPSGAGKSTLLNILAGYVTAGVKGSIKINDHPRDMKIFNKLSSYIMQEDIVQPRLTVYEAMIFAASVKLGSNIKHEQKIAVVNEVITLLGLEKCKDTRSEYLSGGQRKRLTVALELVNNPPVIFLDEPTSGLDNYAIKQCMELLQKISKLGRTVICTIHQPPTSLFQTFDQVYMLANGYCIYNGKPTELIPFLSTAGFPCPQSNTPADYIIEIVHNTPSTIQILSNLSQNGRTNLSVTNRSFNNNNSNISNDTDNNDYNCIEVYKETTQSTITNLDLKFPTSFTIQLKLLLGRMFLQMCRNKTMLYIQFFHHLISGLLVGGSFYGTGNDGSQTIAVFKYCVVCNVFFMYTYVMSPVLLFPLEIKLMKREYFNRWYSLRAYYVALTIATIPLLLVLCIMYSAIVYLLADLPMELDRFIGFALTGIMIALCSQGLGYAIGSLFTIKNGSVIGPSVLGPLLALSVYGMGYRDKIEPFMKVLMTVTYLRFGIVSYCNAIFYKRPPLPCENEIYCHYRWPEILMKDMDMPISHYYHQLYIVVIFTFIFRISSFLSLKLRLNADLSNKIVHIANKVIKQKH